MFLIVLKWYIVYILQMKDIHSKVCIEENFNPWKLFIINLFPFPLWVANSLALRKLVGLKLPFYASYSGVIGE